ncbi:MAG TPA: anaerobic C4-dicarboxylate transporter family protein [Acidimicrobiales bacterium]|jgi:anaerobic C4-dicarboxylate transporter DcuA/anaerobic C4-dicarboxylate transporter DcuB
MDTLLLVVHGLVVLACIYLGVKEGGLGLGIYGLLGVFVLVYGFHLAPGSPPTDAVFIVIAVIAAASAMQAAGGVDWMVSVAARVIRARPQSVTYLAPAMSFLFTVGAGTGNIYYPLLPVIYDVSYRQKLRPERPLAISAVASQVGILCSPVSAATAALVTLYEASKDSDTANFDLTKVLIVMWPACIVGLAVAAFFQARRGVPLEEDPVYQARLAAGQIKPPPEAEIDSKTLGPNAKRSALIFLAGVGVIVMLGLFENLRPEVSLPGQDASRVSVAVTIQIVMGAVGALILLLPGVKGSDVAKQPTFTAGMTGGIALFGLSWLAGTFVANHQDEINNALADVVQDHKILFAVALFIVGALTTSQSGTTNAIVPVGLSLGLSAATVTAMWPAVMGMYSLPANGSQVATVAFDQTGTTKIGKFVINHSFLMPVMIFIVVAIPVAFLLSPLV